MITIKVLLALIAGFAMFIQSQIASATQKSQGTVNTCSAVMPDECITSQVRNSNTGMQVRLPGGTWIDCASDCSRKLREKTVDYWHEHWLRY